MGLSPAGTCDRIPLGDDRKSMHPVADFVVKIVGAVFFAALIIGFFIKPKSLDEGSAKNRKP
ncbi:MAG: hypothetical protein R3236_08590 [Phycisphaeraceae bacterium]|nr:hypothetical protein [Phycisphaeraceae bacterium]